MSRYIDPTTDFGFKKLFGNKAHKEIAASFIADVLELEAPLRDIRFEDKEQTPDANDERTGIYDVYCTDDKWNHFLVEMQKSRIAYVKDRMVYYSTFPISKQAPKGIPLSKVAEPLAPYGKNTKRTNQPWDFRLDGVYCIAVLGYILEDGGKTAVTRTSIRNDKAPYEVFYPKLKYITIELPLFDETLPEYSLDLHLNKWLYFLNYLPALDQMPEFFKGDPVFEKAFALAEYYNLTREEQYRYEQSLKKLWTAYAELTTAQEIGMKKGMEEGMKKGVEEGMEKGMEIGMEKGLAEGVAKGLADGIAKGKMEVAQALLQKGSNPAFVAEVTGLPMEAILELQKL